MTFFKKQYNCDWLDTHEFITMTSSISVTIYCNTVKLMTNVPFIAICNKKKKNSCRYMSKKDTETFSGHRSHQSFSITCLKQPTMMISDDLQNNRYC